MVHHFTTYLSSSARVPYHRRPTQCSPAFMFAVPLPFAVKQSYKLNNALANCPAPFSQMCPPKSRQSSFFSLLCFVRLLSLLSFLTTHFPCWATYFAPPFPHVFFLHLLSTYDDPLALFFHETRSCRSIVLLPCSYSKCLCSCLLRPYVGFAVSPLRCHLPEFESFFCRHTTFAYLFVPYKPSLMTLSFHFSSSLTT